MLRAFDSKSEETLIHPALGILKAKCTKLNIREDADQRGAYYLNIEFVETGKIEKKSFIAEKKEEFVSFAATFLSEISEINELLFEQSQIVETLKMVHSFLVTRNGVGLFAHGIYDTAKSGYNIRDEIYSINKHLKI